MRKNQEKIVSYLEERIKLDDKELIFDYDANSVILIDRSLRVPIILHFIYIDEEIVLVSDNKN